MSINEEQEIPILKIFIDNNIDVFSSMQFPKPITDFLGSGAHAVIKNMIRDGFVADLFNSEYQFTEVGKRRYRTLLRKKSNERIIVALAWVAALAAITGATYASLTYYGTADTKPQKSQKQEILIKQKKDSPIQTSKHDTIMAQHFDSLKQK